MYPRQLVTLSKSELMQFVYHLEIRVDFWNGPLEVSEWDEKMAWINEII